MLILNKIWAHVRRSSQVVTRFVERELFAEAPSLRRANRKVTQQIEQALRDYSKVAEQLRPIAEGLTLDDVRRYVASEAERRKSLEDKAKANLVAITIGFTVLFASINFFAKKESNTPIRGLWAAALFIFLMIGVCYLLYGGLKAIDSLQLRSVYNPSPEDDSGLRETMRKIKLLWCLEQNERTTLLRANAIDVSYRAIRNGVFTLAACIVILAVRLITL